MPATPSVMRLMYRTISNSPQEEGRFISTPDAANTMHKAPVMMKDHERGTDITAAISYGHLGLSVLGILNHIEYLLNSKFQLLIRL